MKNNTKTLNLQRQIKEHCVSTVNLLILSIIFIVGIIGSWNAGGVFMKELLVGAFIFSMLLMINYRESQDFN